MEAAQKSRIHPLAAGAAVAVIIVSAVGVAAMTGHLPGSKAEIAPASRVSALPQSVAATPAAPLPVATVPVVNAAPKSTAYSSPPNQQIAAASQSTVAQAHPICANCGVVNAVNAVKRQGKGGYVGMIGAAWSVPCWAAK